MKKKKQSIILPKLTKFKKLQKGRLKPIERKKNYNQSVLWRLWSKGFKIQSHS